MKNKIIGWAAIFGLAGALLVPALGAFGQAVPVPFSGLIAGSFTADAGFFASLNVNGLPVTGGLSNPLAGTFTADAGNFGKIQVATETLADAGGIELFGETTACLTGYSTVPGFMALYPTSCAAADNTNWILVSSQDQTNVQMQAASGGQLYWKIGGTEQMHLAGDGTGLTVAQSIIDNGEGTFNASLLTVGFNNTRGTMSADAGAFSTEQVGPGTSLTNIGVGSCSLASGQCNAVVAGAQGSSLCTASVQGTSQTLVGCDVRADAGSATAFCNASASGTAAVICFN